LLIAHFSEGTLPRWVVSRFLMHAAVLHLVWSSFRWGCWYSGLLQWIADSRYKKV